MKTYKLNNYPDGTSYVNKTSTEIKSFRINDYKQLWELNQYVDAFINAHGFEPTICIPNLIDAQADRRFNKGESSGLKLVLKFLASLPVNKYYIFHPHNQEVVEAMLDNVNITDNSKYIRDVLKELSLEIPSMENNLILMSSDAGGFKPLMKLCDDLDWKGETYSATKARTNDGMKQIVDREDFGGKDILIIDDISVYGGTFKGLSKLLRERNCGKLYLGVSHMTVQDLGEDPVTNYFDKVFTTNSKFNNYYYYLDSSELSSVVKPENLKIIKLF